MKYLFPVLKNGRLFIQVGLCRRGVKIETTSSPTVCYWWCWKLEKLSLSSKERVRYLCGYGRRRQRRRRRKERNESKKEEERKKKVLSWSCVLLKTAPASRKKRPVVFFICLDRRRYCAVPPSSSSTCSFLFFSPPNQGTTKSDTNCFSFPPSL